MEVRCDKTTKNLNQIAIDLDRVSIDLGNATNKLLFISNSKFVENRVQEEDETAVQPKSTVDEAPKPMDMMEAMKIAAQNSVEMMNKCYEQVSLLDSGDEDESDDEDNRNKCAIFFFVITIHFIINFNFPALCYGQKNQ